MRISRRQFTKLSAAASVGLAAPAIWTKGRAQNRPVRVGCSASLTGPLSGTKNMVIGYELWRDDVNAAGGLLGREVELIVYDDQSAPSNVPAIYSKLVDVDQVDFLFTPYGANLTATIMPFAKQRDRFIVGILTLASNDQLKHDKFFQAAPWGPDGATNWARGFFDIANSTGVKKMAILAADTEFSKTAAEGGRRVSEEFGMDVVDFQMYPPTNRDFSAIIRNIRATEPEAVFVCSYPADSTAIVHGIQEIGLGDSARLFGGGMVGPQYASLMESLGPSLNGIVNFHLYVPEPTMKFEGIESFLDRYRPIAEDRQVDPLGFYIPPFCYAAGQFISTAVNATGSLDQTEVSNWLHENPVDTVVGQINFDEIGNWTERRVLMIQFQNVDGSGIDQFRQAGKEVIIDPPDYKSGELVPLMDARKT
ncbi:amino acid ABC transporter substrate-binding protein [Chelativorans salis]|uniref:Amino acid ABC transporter substrate-binding protein n=1 Tax=Chelativorans salis TaxID=2978478 RepID=A0ABT2LLB3_9HYPH|nr:amino acid ABC transporter substrate-binding protein [Chelativorans sp. EGI FJ00035]MCT7374607.1 amino acid ABC transporter substrate-binding protein [Chelativorans sp. EGI FJ00035]